MSAQHTPHPWIGKKGSGGQGLIYSEQTGANVAVAYDERDTALLAAAPELKAALTALVNCPDYEGIKTHEMREARSLLSSLS